MVNNQCFGFWTLQRVAFLMTTSFMDMDCCEIWNGFYEWCLRRNCSLGSTGTLHITQSAGWVIEQNFKPPPLTAIEVEGLFQHFCCFMKPTTIAPLSQLYNYCVKTTQI